MRRLLVILLAVLCGGGPCFAYTGVPVVQSNGFYVNDYAPFLNDSHRGDILLLSNDLYSQTGVQVVVLTVESLGGAEIDEYGQAVIKGWGIGGPDGSQGALILVSAEDRQAKVFLGSGLDPLPSYLDAQIEVGANNVSRSIMNVYRPLVADIYALHGVTPSEEMAKLLDNTPAPAATPFTTGTIVFFAVILLVTLRSLRTSRKYRSKYLKGNIRKTNTYTRSYDEEQQYGDEKRYRIDYDDQD